MFELINVLILGVVFLFALHLLVGVMYFITSTLTGFVTKTVLTYLRIIIIMGFTILCYFYYSNILEFVEDLNITNYINSTNMSSVSFNLTNMLNKMNLTNIFNKINVTNINLTLTKFGNIITNLTNKTSFV